MEHYKQLRQDILMHLYRYRGLTAQQLCIVTQRSHATIYNHMSSLAKENLIDKGPVPFLAKGAKVYFLTPEGAKVTSEYLRESAYFEPKEWESLSDNLLLLLSNNQIYCELIKATVDIEEAGLIDWYGKQATAHKYLGPGKSTSDYATVPDSYGVFQLPKQQGRLLLHTVVFSGEETPMIIENCIKNFQGRMKEYWTDQVDQVSILFLSHVKSQVNRIVDIWKILSDKNIELEPTIGVAAYQDVIRHGVFAKIWNVKSERMSLEELPTLPHDILPIDRFIGKNPVIPLFSSSEVHRKSDNIKSESEDKPEEKEVNSTDNSVKSKTEEQPDFNWVSQ